MSPSFTSRLPRFIGMKFKAVTFIDSSFINCYFEDVSSVGSLFKNCTFLDSFFYNTGACLSGARLFLPVSGDRLAEGTHTSLIHDRLMPELSQDALCLIIYGFA